MERNEKMGRDNSEWNECLDDGQWNSGSLADDMSSRQFSSAADGEEEEYEDYDLGADEGSDDWDNNGMESGSDPETNETMPYRSDRHNGWKGNPTGDGGYGSQGGEP